MRGFLPLLVDVLGVVLHVAAVEHGVLRRCDVDERRLHARQHVLDATDVDVAVDLADVVGGPADVVLDQVAALEHGHLRHARAHLHRHEVAADRLAVALATAALSRASHASMDSAVVGTCPLPRPTRPAALLRAGCRSRPASLRADVDPSAVESEPPTRADARRAAAAAAAAACVAAAASSTAVAGGCRGPHAPGLAVATSGSASCRRSGACAPAPARRLRPTGGLRSSAPGARRRSFASSGPVRSSAASAVVAHLDESAVSSSPVARRSARLPDGAGRHANPVVAAEALAGRRLASRSFRRATDRRIRVGPGRYRSPATHGRGGRQRMSAGPSSGRSVVGAPSAGAVGFDVIHDWGFPSQGAAERGARPQILASSTPCGGFRLHRDVRIRRSRSRNDASPTVERLDVYIEPTRRCMRTRSWVRSSSKSAIGRAILACCDAESRDDRRCPGCAAHQRMRRMWTLCTRPNIAKYTIRPEPP